MCVLLLLFPLFCGNKPFFSGREPLKTTASKADILVKSGLVKSGSEARRLLKQGAISFNDSKVTQETLALRENGILKVGSRRFLKVVTR